MALAVVHERVCVQPAFVEVVGPPAQRRPVFPRLSDLPTATVCFVHISSVPQLLVSVVVEERLELPSVERRLQVLFLDTRP